MQRKLPNVYGVNMRADKFFADRYGSRTKAAEAIRQGLILRDQKELSPDDEVCETDEFTFIAPRERFVSNGGYKLSRALDVFRQSVEGLVLCDLGASNGGFTDCLLQRGAKKVFCVDVGKSQLHETLRNDDRVVVMDETNARYLTRNHFPVSIDAVVSDLSFISLRLILPSIFDILSDGGLAFVLFKPQFECEGKGIGKSGIVPIGNHKILLERFYKFACDMKLAPVNIVNAPIREKKNIEYIILLQRNGIPIKIDDFLNKAKYLL